MARYKKIEVLSKRTFDGISSNTIPNQSSETPVFAWSRVMWVSFRKVDVRTPETLVRSMAIHVNMSCDAS